MLRSAITWTTWERTFKFVRSCVTKQLVLRRLSRIMYEPSRRYPSEFDHFHYSRHLHPQIPHGSPNLKEMDSFTALSTSTWWRRRRQRRQYWACRKYHYRYRFISLLVVVNGNSYAFIKPCPTQFIKIICSSHRIWRVLKKWAVIIIERIIIFISSFHSFGNPVCPWNSESSLLDIRLFRCISNEMILSSQPWSATSAYLVLIGPFQKQIWKTQLEEFQWPVTALGF
jgi:hypothetical protein